MTYVIFRYLGQYGIARKGENPPGSIVVDESDDRESLVDTLHELRSN